ncbi:MAG: hypothetical protein NC201_01600 [Prevotella sp.]|nr:hypothetical protein [Bacteroides sp.]MCM1365923.1 hypothetical protein [Prevotella sp.]MCM1436656.1 hypothetical protein [Prevotella sp.]
MKFESKLKDKIGKDTGYILPEGSLEGVYSHVMENLPKQNPMKAPKITVWQKVRPYVYMAAMFAGIWCMMKIFHTVSIQDISLDNPPEFVAEAIVNSPTQEEFYTACELNDFELEQEVSEQYSDIDSFEKEFGYEFEPEYANISIPESSTK